MSKRSKSIRLRHMLDHAREALTLAQGRTREDLDSDRLLNLALVRLLEVVGEAANRVPKDEVMPQVFESEPEIARRLARMLDEWDAEMERNPRGWL